MFCVWFWCLRLFSHSSWLSVLFQWIYITFCLFLSFCLLHVCACLQVWVACLALFPTRLESFSVRSPCCQCFSFTCCSLCAFVCVCVSRILGSQLFMFILCFSYTFSVPSTFCVSFYCFLLSQLSPMFQCHCGSTCPDAGQQFPHKTANIHRMGFVSHPPSLETNETQHWEESGPLPSLGLTTLRLDLFKSACQICSYHLVDQVRQLWFWRSTLARGSCPIIKNTGVRLQHEWNT